MEDAGGSEEMKPEAWIRAALREHGPSTVHALALVTGLNEGSLGNEVTRMKKADRIQIVGKEGHAAIYDLPTESLGVERDNAV